VAGGCQDAEQRNRVPQGHSDERRPTDTLLPYGHHRVPCDRSNATLGDRRRRFARNLRGQSARPTHSASNIALRARGHRKFFARLSRSRTSVFSKPFQYRGASAARRAALAVLHPNAEFPQNAGQACSSKQHVISLGPSSYPPFRACAWSARNSSAQSQGGLLGSRRRPPWNGERCPLLARRRKMALDLTLRRRVEVSGHRTDRKRWRSRSALPNLQDSAAAWEHDARSQCP